MVFRVLGAVPCLERLRARFRLHEKFSLKLKLLLNHLSNRHHDARHTDAKKAYGVFLLVTDH
jgi:hypothetical protein